MNFRIPIRFSIEFSAVFIRPPILIVVMQKMMPRLHGARRRLEPVLRELGSFCFHGRAPDNAQTFDPESPPAGDPVLPTAFVKLQRMTRRLRANQFASFAE